jgi:hypothetical protein
MVIRRRSKKLKLGDLMSNKYLATSIALQTVVQLKQKTFI